MRWVRYLLQPTYDTLATLRHAVNVERDFVATCLALMALGIAAACVYDMTLKGYV